MSATLQAIVNGGPPQTGGIDVADGDVVQLTAASKVGWGNPATRWEIYDHPDGFAPAGWTADPGGVGFYFVGSADPPSFTMDGDLWGKYLTRVTGPDGKPDESTILCLPSPIGLRGIARRESGQFGGDTRLWLGEYNRDLRAISTLVNPASSSEKVWTASGDATGATDRVSFQAAVNALPVGGVLRCKGQAYFDAPIVFSGKTGIKIRGLLWRQGTAWVTVGTESVANYAMRIEPTALGGTTTVATTVTPAQTAPISLASAASFSPGVFFAIKGTANDQFDASGGVEEEIFKVASVNVNDVTSAWPIAGYHGSTRTVTRYSGVSEDVAFEDCVFDMYTTPTVYAAGAIYAVRAKDIRVTRCEFKGATWVAVNFDACRGARLDDSVDLGANQALIHMNSCQGGGGNDCYSRHEIHERKSSKGGKARWHWSLQNRCRNVVFSNMRAEFVNGGLRAWGSMGCSLDVFATDVDGTLIKADAPDDTIVTPHGLLLDTGANSLAVAEFGFGNDTKVIGTQVLMGAGEDYVTPIGYMFPAFYLHDWLQCTGYLRCFNKTSGAFLTRDLRLGINVTDATGRYDVLVNGCRIGLCTNNNFGNISGTLIFNATSASGTTGGYAWGALASDLAPMFELLSVGGDFSFGFFSSHISTISTYSLRFPFARVMIGAMQVNDTTLGGFVPAQGGNFFEWRDVKLARMPNSTANWGNNDRYRRIGRVFPLADTTAIVREVIDTPAAATVRGCIVADQCPNDAGGVERILLVVECGANAVAMVRTGTATLSTRARLESNATGELVAQGAFNADTLCTRLGPRVTALGYVQASGG